MASNAEMFPFDDVIMLCKCTRRHLIPSPAVSREDAVGMLWHVDAVCGHSDHVAVTLETGLYGRLLTYFERHFSNPKYDIYLSYSVFVKCCWKTPKGSIFCY